ncbi:NAD(P)/FAD-dependent oxidoreductase [Isachenkonia alkalipeptolytica]|uniref:Thioredoxin reductase n=1 Tax=Isachenkonia alkalipeptolytica TaxID=2565777 RepID=A0AA43XL87_9CLOT|nr:FAD-dependent oxidoreductase [Isachenkonia alkalipeptolytica]NBG88371.1 thioredoxin reductase [Isachenkonia alkalipeptolytica]
MELNLDITQEPKVKLEEEVLYDTLIIGGGPAGLNTALYAKRKGMKVGIITERLGGQVMDTSMVENYLGYESMTGEGLVNKFISHVQNLQVPILKEVRVEKLSKEGELHKVHLNNGEVYQSRTLVLATGSKPRKLGIPGEQEFSGKGVAYCAICDGPFFEGLDVVIAGGGNTAVESALDLAKIATKVDLVHRSQFRADQVLVDQLKNYDNIHIHLDTQMEEILGEAMVTGIKVLDKNTGEQRIMNTNGIFVEIGYLPNSDAFQDYVEVNDRKEIIVDGYGRTNVKGVFAAGDITTIPYKQIITSAGDGAKVALAVNDYLNTHAKIEAPQQVVAK